MVARLSEDVGISKRVLYDALRLYRTFGIVPAQAQLGWAHFRVLLSVPTQKARQHYRRAALDGEWSLRELEAAVKSDPSGTDASAGQDPQKPGVPQAPKRLAAKRLG